MNNIKIGLKLIASFLIIVALTMALGAYLISSMNTINKHDTELYQKGAVPLGDMVTIAANTQKYRMYGRAIILARNPAEVEKLVRDADKMAESLNDAVEEQLDLALTEAGKKLLLDLKEAINLYQEELETNIKLVQEGRKDIATDRIFAGPFVEAAKNMEIKLNTCVDRKLLLAKGLSESNNASAESASRIALILLFLVAAVSIVLGIILTRSLTQPLAIVVATLTKMENGDLTARASIRRGDELGLLANSLDSLAAKLQKILKGLRVNSDTLAGASEELSAVSRQLSTGAEAAVSQTVAVASTTEQMASNITAMASASEEASVNANEVASAAEQMSANMNAVAVAVEEMSASIGQIARNAGEARDVTVAANRKAGDATSSMAKLGEAAREIGKVTEVIKRIADKTNLLALNATIEAASAGEAGKGFAVVANEIKELANQSAQAADDIARRIEGVQTGTGDAVKVIDDVTQIITKIDLAVNAIAQNVDQQTRASNEIASNVAQASTGAKRVASAIGEVAKGTNDVSRNAGEAAKGANHVASNVSSISTNAKEASQGAGQVNSSARDLSRMAGELQETVALFQV
jgi:methyl-accepting chemotaxis protein